MEVRIDRKLKESCNVSLGCIFYKTNVVKTNNVVDTNNLISIETGYSVGSYDLENYKVV